MYLVLKGPAQGVRASSLGTNATKTTDGPDRQKAADIYCRRASADPTPSLTRNFVNRKICEDGDLDEAGNLRVCTSASRLLDLLLEHPLHDAERAVDLAAQLIGF